MNVYIKRIILAYLLIVPYMVQATGNYSKVYTRNYHVVHTLNSYQSRNIAIAKKRAKEVFVATANGDIAKLKQLLTPEFYKRYYPYSDSKMREILLSVPYEQRQKMVDQALHHDEITAFTNRAGDVITVTFANKNNNKMFTMQLMDEYGNGDWRVFDYDYIK